MHQEVETTRSGGGGEFGRGEVILFFREEATAAASRIQARERELCIDREQRGHSTALCPGSSGGSVSEITG